MYSQNGEIGVLEVLEIKTFFAAQRCWEDLYKRPFLGVTHISCYITYILLLLNTEK